VVEVTRRIVDHGLLVLALVLAATFQSAGIAFGVVGERSSSHGARPTVGKVVSVLVVDPTRPSTLYAGSSTSHSGPGYVYKSADGGRSWRQMFAGLEGNPVEALAIDPRTPSILYAGTVRNFIPTKGGLFKTTDGGRRWRRLGIGPAAQSVTALAIDPRSPTIVYVGADVDAFSERGGGLFKTTNGGSSWKAMNAGLPTSPWVDALAIDPQRPETLYIATDGDLFKTTNGGRKWRRADTGLASSASTLAIDRRRPTTLYAASSDYGGVFKTTNGGRSWRSVNTGLGRFTHVEALAVDPRRSGTVYVGTYSETATTRTPRVFKTTNGGGSWRAANVGLPKDETVWDIAVDPLAPATVYAGTSGAGVFKSVDGGRSWRSTG
jgi:photosystem II stability/assembly factor-like uncharacterized protein